MKRILTLTVLLLALRAGAQFPPPYVHNYWSTQAQAQVNSPIMNASKQVTNPIISPSAGVGTLSSTLSFTAQSSGTSTPLVVDEFSGLFALAKFLSVISGQQILFSSNADISISGVYYGNGAGLTNLPISASTGIATNGGSGAFNWLTNTILNTPTNYGRVSIMDAANAASGPITLTNLSGALYIGSGLGNATVLAGSWWGDGAHLTALNASQLTSGTVADARQGSDVLLTNGATAVVNFSTVATSGNITAGGSFLKTFANGAFVVDSGSGAFGFRMQSRNDSIGSINVISGNNTALFAADTFSFGIPKWLRFSTDGAGGANNLTGGGMISYVPGSITVSNNLAAIGSLTATNGVSGLRSNLLAWTAFTFPATTVTWANPLPVSIMVAIDNTAVTGTAVKINGTTVFSGLSTDVMIPLQAGESFSETYTVGTPSGTYHPFP